MASDSQKRQIVFQAGSVVSVDEHPIDLDQIKQIGLYTKQEFFVLKDLYFDLLEILHRDDTSGLYEVLDNQKIIIRIKYKNNATGELNNVELTTESDPPSTPGLADKRTLFFFIDFVSVILGFAKLLQSHFPTPYLAQYTFNFEEEDQLRLWGAGVGKNYVSEEALRWETAAIQELLTQIFVALQQIEKELNSDNETDTAPPPSDTSIEEKINERPVFLPPILMGPDEKELVIQAGETPDAPPPPQVILDESSNQRKLTISRLAVFNFSRAMLLDRILREGGFDPSNLPPELAARYNEITGILYSELDSLINSMNGDELLAFISGNVSERIVVFQLLREITNAQQMQFFAICQDFWREEVVLLERERKLREANQVATIITETVTTIAQEIPELEALKNELIAWKREVESETQRLAETADRVVVTASTDDEEPVVLPDPPVVIPEFQSRVQSLPTVQNLSTNEQAVIPNRSGHVIWGTMAELFTEDDIKRNSIPPELFNAVTQATYEYLNSLTPQELRKLAASPSSLIRHIKNVSLRIQTDAVFAQTYADFKAAYNTPVINRTERIEIETRWANENVKYELFIAHNITDALIEKSPQLRKEYRDVEHDLETKIYGIFLSFSTEYLQTLYFNPQERQNLILRLQRTLNADPQFLRELSEFYNELIVYLAEQQQLEQQQEIIESLKRSNHSVLQEEGAIRYIVSDVQLSEAHKLFIDQLRRDLRTDSQPVLQNTANILDALLITHGAEETTRLILGISPQLLEMTFGLPPGLVDATNHKAIREILSNYATVRIFNITPAEGKSPTAYLPGSPVVPSTATGLVRHLEPVHNVTKIVEQEGSEKTSLALNGGVKQRIDALEKVLGQKWRNLNLEERATIYLYFDKPFDNSLKQRLKSHSADLENDKHILTVFIEFAGFSDRLLPELVKDARNNGFLRLTGTPITAPPADELLDHYYQQLKLTRQLELELALASFEELSIAEQELIAAEHQLTAAALIGAYEAALVGGDETLYQLPGLEALNDDVTDGAAPTAASGSGRRRKGKLRTAIDGKIAGLRKKATGKIKEKLAKSAAGKVATQLGGKLATAATGLGVVITAGSFIKEAFENEQVRTLILGGATFLTAMLFNVIGNIAGLLTFAAVSFLGGFTLPAIFGGLALGQVVASAMPWARWLPQSRMPPNPFGFTGTEHSASGYPSLSQMRGKAPAGPTSSSAANAAAAKSGTGSGVSPDGSTAGTSLTGSAQITTSTTTAATVTSSAFSQLAALPIAILAPAIGMFTVFISTILVITVIAGAFLAPVPTRPNAKQTLDGLGQQSTSKYVTITKTPSIGGKKGEIQNRTDVPVTYTITIEPKTGYQIKPTAVKDIFSGIGETTSNFESKLDFSKFPTEAIKEPFTTSYTINTGTSLVDALILNAVTVTFDVYDYTGYAIETGETYTATAAIYVGNPKVGCWPTSGDVWQLPGGSFSHAHLDAFDISNEIGTPVYAPFPGSVCDKGIDPAPSGGYGRYASVEFSLGSTGPLVLFFGHFVKGPKDIMSGSFDARGCRPVNAGEVIGLMDDTGFSTASHLHYELRPNTFGVKLKDLHPDGQQVINQFNSGKFPVTVRDCFGGK